MSEKDKKTIDEKIACLDEKISWFYDDNFDLSDAYENYKSAKILANEIKDDLDNLKNEITILNS